jgi:alpha-galactosidase
MSEYVPYFRKNPEIVTSFVASRRDYYDICTQKKDALDGEIHEQIEGRYEIKMRGSVECESHIIHSVVMGNQIRINGNVNNSRLITNLLKGCCVKYHVLSTAAESTRAISVISLHSSRR